MVLDQKVKEQKIMKQNSFFTQIKMKYSKDSPCKYVRALHEIKN